MCVLEAVSGAVPFSPLDDLAAKHQVQRKNLPLRPAEFKDDEWQLFKDMCCFKPSERITINMAVQRLKNIADAARTG